MVVGTIYKVWGITCETTVDDTLKVSYFGGGWVVGAAIKVQILLVVGCTGKKSILEPNLRDGMKRNLRSLLISSDRCALLPVQ